LIFQTVKALVSAAIAAALAVAVFIAAVLLTELPQFWACLILAVACFLAMRRSTTTRRRVLWWNCAAVLVIWAAVDLGASVWISHTGGVFEPNIARGAVGVRLRALVGPLRDGDGVESAAKQAEDIARRMNPSGLRTAAPIADGDQQQGCVLFFGCSFTYGEGVAGEETFAALVPLKTDGRFVSRNLGVSGSAPHYALAQLEGGMVDNVARCHPTHAIYLLLPHHLVRVSGKFAVRFGPKYALDPNGELVRIGSLTTTREEFLWDLVRYTSAFYVAKYGYDTYAAPDAGDVALMVAILRRFETQLTARYPGIRFDILYWDDQTDEMTLELGKQLRLAGLRVHNVSAFLPEIREWRSSAYLSRTDHHPSAWAHDRIAEYVVRNILQSPTP
jgi:hypothetical protein